MALSLAVFILYVNWLAALLSAVGFFYYTAIYTRWLKRNTWQNIVIGGGAGAIPPLIGWAAASSELTWSSLMLFAIIFYWTPPHFWALAIMKKNDYAAANVPMLPVVAGDKETAKQIVIYTVGMIALTLVLVPLQMMGNVYLLGAAGLGCVFLWRAWQVYKDQSRPVALKLYTFSLLYLALLFLIMMIDRLSMS
jgi:protoheme IX farnesyltransferase